MHFHELDNNKIKWQKFLLLQQLESFKKLNKHLLQLFTTTEMGNSGEKCVPIYLVPCLLKEKLNFKQGHQEELTKCDAHKLIFEVWQ